MRLSKKLEDTPLSKINSIFPSSEFSMYEKICGTKLSIKTNKFGTVESISYKRRKIIEAYMLINKNVYTSYNCALRILKNFRLKPDSTFAYIEDFNVPTGRYSTSEIKIPGCHELINGVSVLFPDVEYKSKKVFVNYIKKLYFSLLKEQGRTKDSSCKVLFLRSKKDGEFYSIPIDEEACKESESLKLDSSYYIASKRFISDFHKYIKENEHTFYSQEDDECKRKIGLCEKFVMSSVYAHNNDKEIGEIFKIFSKNYNYSLIPINVARSEKVCFFCSVVQMFVISNKLMIDKFFLTDVDQEKFCYIKEKLDKSYKKIFISY